MRKKRDNPLTISRPFNCVSAIDIKIDRLTGMLHDVPVEFKDAFPSAMIGSFSASDEIGAGFIPARDRRFLRSISFDQSNRQAYKEFKGIDLRLDNPTSAMREVTKIGSGLYSVIYKGFRVGVPIVIKQMEAKERYRKFIAREILAMKEVNSKHVIRYISSHLVDKHVMILMPFMDGGMLADLVLKAGLTESHIAYFAKRVLKGIAALHRVGIIHRDIKSANVFLGKDGSVVVGDLGFAVPVDRCDNEVVGTANWMSPEVINSGEYGFASDMWAFGVVCIEIADGYAPYVRLPPRKVMEVIGKRGLPPLSKGRDWSPEFVDFIRRCHVMDPAGRATAVELLGHPFLTRACNREEVAVLLNSNVDRMRRQSC